MYRVFSRPIYSALALFSASIVYLTFAWAPAAWLLMTLVHDPALSAAQKISLISHLLRESLTQFGMSDLVYALASALLIGINSALLIFYYRMHQRLSLRPATGSIVGGIAAVVGFGCAACGSIFLAAMFRIVGGAGLSAILPYDGAEIGYAGLALLLYSAYKLVRAINAPEVCYAT